MNPEVLGHILQSLPKDPKASDKLLTRQDTAEDAAVVRVPQGKALVQSVDFFTPVVADPYRFGQIAAANALSDIYAMGGEPWCAMNMVCFPVCFDLEILKAILHGGMDKLLESGACLAGGHSIDDTGIKYGLSVTGIVDPASFASNTGLAVGDVLVVTKALGTGVLATALKAEWEGFEEIEATLYASASRLNKAPGQVIAKLGLKAATDITGFGMGGHLLEMLEASDMAADIHAQSLALLPRATELAATGLLPAGSYANRQYASAKFCAREDVDPLRLDLIFDAQTSGGMILAIPPKKLAEAKTMLEDAGELLSIIGEVHEARAEQPRLTIFK